MYAYFTSYIRNLTRKNSSTTMLHQDVFFSCYKFIFLKGNITCSKLGKIHATDTAYIVYFISSVTKNRGTAES
jgi:hypothetical protein